MCRTFGWLLLCGLLGTLLPSVAWAQSDLEVASVTGLPGVLQPAATVNVKVCVKNTGAAAASSFKVALFFSTDDEVTVFDTKIAEAEVKLLATGSSACPTLTFQLSQTSAAGKLGDHWIAALADWDKKVGELDEGNNTSQAIKVKIPGPDLVVSTFSGLPTTPPKPGDALSLQVCVKNEGSVNVSAAFDVGVYYSADRFIDRTDTQLSTFPINALAAGAQVCKTVSITLPANANIGSGAVGVFVDYNDKVVEERDDNNIERSLLTPRPDLVVDLITGVPARAVSGTSVSVTVCVKNVGDANAAAFVTGVHYSDNETITPSDPLLGDASFSSGLAKGARACQTVSGKLPTFFKLGDNFVGAFADRTLKVTELVETNNTGAVKFSNPAPELEAISLKGVPSIAKPGASFSVEVCVTNKGDADATSSFKVFYYHSIDAEITNQDTKLGEVTYNRSPALAQQQTLCMNLKITLPTSMPLRGNYVGVVVDPTAAVAEGDESNNTFSVAFSNPAPDLSIDAITGVPKNANAGSQFTASVCVRNNGNLALTKPVKVRLVHSDNVDISLLDTRLGEKTLASLQVDALSCVQFSVTLSSSYVVAGTNWIGAIVDTANDVEELDEKNNTGSASFTSFAPDLTITSLRGVPKGAAGRAAFYVDVCVKNAGTEDANSAFLVTVYHSTDTFVTKSDTPIGVGTITSLAKGQTACVVITATLPANLQRGANYVGAMVDSGEVIKELDENNNITPSTAFQDTTLRIDLQIDSVTGVPAQANGGDNLSIKVCVKNADTSNATSFKVGLYYSKDVSVSIYTDTKLGTVTFANGVPGGQTSCETVTGTLPAQINLKPQGNWLGIFVDVDLVVPETNKANNLKVIRFEEAGGFPDLVIDAINQVPSLGLPGYAVNDVEVCVRNIGRAPANPPLKVNLYHSLDKSIDRNDTVVASHSFVSSIAPSTTVCQKLSGKLPTKVNPGDNWLGAFVDPDELVREVKDDNNTKAAKFYIDVPDLVVKEITGVPKTAEGGDTINAKICVENKGVKDATAFKLQVSLNPDNNGKSAKLNTADFPNGLAKGKSDCKTFQLTLPTPLDPGTRSIEAFVDSEKKILEADEDNNKKTADFKVPGPDLTVSSFALTPAFGAAGASIAAKVCLKNIGGKDVAAGFVVRLFDSTDDTIDNKDTKIGEYSYGTADLGQFKAGSKEICRTINVTVPRGVKEGRRYFGVFVEADEKIKEEDENNNTQSAQFVVPSKTKPNLVAESITLASRFGQPGGKVNVEVCFQNYGVTLPPTTAITVGVYYATSKTVTPSLRIHTYTAVQGLAANAKTCVKGDVTLPSNLSLGKAALVGWVDYDNAIAESDEADNRIAEAFEVYLDRDNDGVPAGIDCDDNDKTVHPAFDIIAPANERCDGKDNDCNGTIDDNFPNVGKACTVGQGECAAQGKWVCSKDQSKEVCDATAGKPTAEQCDGKDNDCDGKIDNEGDKACPAGQFCVQGQCQSILCVFNKHCPTGLICKQGLCQRPKSCQQDSDCERLETCKDSLCTQQACSKHSDCPIDSLCLGEVCVPACTGDSMCGPNHLCVDGRCWKQCTSSNDCHSSQACIRGQCQDKCSPACPTGERCLNQTCVENSCYGYRCPNAQICLKKSCTRDPCHEKQCAAGEFCTEGQCRKSCGKTTCPAGQICDGATCRDDACKDRSCGADEVCVLGQCHPNTCKDGTCGAARYCKNNVCEDDPCAHVTCPDPQNEVCQLDDEGAAQCVAKTTQPPTESSVEETTSEAVVPQEPTPQPDASAEPTPERKPESPTTGNDPSTPDDNKEGCTCSTTGNVPLHGVVLGVMLLLGLLRRRS